MDASGAVDSSWNPLPLQFAIKVCTVPPLRTGVNAPLPLTPPGGVTPGPGAAPLSEPDPPIDPGGGVTGGVGVGVGAGVGAGCDDVGAFWLDPPPHDINNNAAAIDTEYRSAVFIFSLLFSSVGSAIWTDK